MPLLDKAVPAFFVKAFPIHKGAYQSVVKAPASLIRSTIDDFYITDSITRNSPTIGEASLFLSSQSSFSREI